LNALGVIQFIKRDFEKAAFYYKNAIKEAPMDHSFWNKYGASLANMMRSPEAIEAYK
jgi:peroxin-5